MTIADSVPWPVALGLAATLALIAFVWGESRRSTYQDERYARLVGDDARQRSALRALYEQVGVPWPDLWDDRREPQPGRWDRLVRRIVGRFRKGEAVEPAPEPVVVAECQDEDAAELEPFVSEPNPPTQPIVMPRLANLDDWRAEQDAQFQQMLSEIRGEKVASEEKA